MERGETLTSPSLERRARFRVSVVRSVSNILAKTPTGTGSDLATAIRIVTCVELRPDVAKAASYSAVTARDVLRKLNAAQEPVLVKSIFGQTIS